AASRSWSTPASAAAPTSARRYAWGRQRLGSADPTSGATAPSGNRVLSAYWNCCGRNCSALCSKSAHRRSNISRPPWCDGHEPSSKIALADYLTAKVLEPGLGIRSVGSTGTRVDGYCWYSEEFRKPRLAQGEPGLASGSSVLPRPSLPMRPPPAIR